MNIINYIKHLFDFRETHLIIVRRYTDANGYYVGELYLYDEWANGALRGYRMIGCSLDNLPIDALSPSSWRLDTSNDFLAPLKRNTVRVGAIEPIDNEFIKQFINKLPRWRMRLNIQNRLIQDISKYAIN